MCRSSSVFILEINSLAAASRPGVGCLVCAGKMLKIKVGIDLRGADVGVPEQFLDRAQIAAGLKQMRRKGMAQQMRVDAEREPLQLRAPRDPGLHQAPADAPARAANE